MPAKIFKIYSNHANLVQTLFTGLFFCLVVIILTYPISRHPCHWIYPYEGGPLNFTWNMSWNLHALKNGNNIFEANVYYPEKKTLTFGLFLFSSTILFGLASFTQLGPIFAYNFVSLISYVIAALATFLWIRSITRNWLSGLIGGLIFGFCHFKIGEIRHFTLQGGWLVLALYFFHCYLKEYNEASDLKTGRVNNRTNQILFIAFVIIQGLDFPYYLIYLCIAMIVLFLFHLHWQKWRLKESLLRNLLLSFLIILVLLFFPYWQYFSSLAKIPDFDRSLDAVVKMSATLENYISVPPTNLLHRLFYFLFYNQPFETVLTKHFDTFGPFLNISLHPFQFPGFIALILAGFGLAQRPKNNQEAYRMQNFFLVLVLLGFILSLGPYLVIKEGFPYRLPLPYILFYKWIPGFNTMRWVARLGIFFQLGVAGLSGIGFLTILSQPKLQKLSRRIFITILIACSLIFEYFSAPLQTVTAPLKAGIPEVYHQLAQKKEDFAIIELPQKRFPGTTDAKYMYYSIYHWKKIAHGHSSYEPSSLVEIRKKMAYFPEHDSLDFLKTMGIQYLIFHNGIKDSYPQFSNKEVLELLEIREINNQDIKLIGKYPGELGWDYLYKLNMPAELPLY